MSNIQSIINSIVANIQDNIQENGVQAITGPVLQEVLVQLVVQLGGAIFTPDDFLLNQYPAYDPAFTYEGYNQVIVKHNGLLWVFLSDIDRTGVTPGTNASVWEQFNGLSLAHPVNKDTHLAFGTADQVSAQEIRSVIDDLINLIELSLTSTDGLSEGTNNLYFTAARVRAVLLTGLSVATNAGITANDSVLSAMGKLQAQITALPTPPATTTNLPEGTNLYFTAARVLATVLTGLTTGTNEAIAATDTVLAAFQKVQAQITALASASGITEIQLKETPRTFDSAQRMKWVSLTHASTVTPVLALGNNMVITVAGNFTLANPSDIGTSAGQSGTIQMIMGGTGTHTVTFGSAYVSDEAAADMQPAEQIGDVTEYGYTVNSAGNKISLYKRGPLTQISI